MSEENREALAKILAGTALRMPDAAVIRHRTKIAFPNSAGMLENPHGQYGSVLMICDVDIFVAGALAVAVATLPRGDRRITGVVTVGVGKADEVSYALSALLAGREPFWGYFDQVTYRADGQH